MSRRLIGFGGGGKGGGGEARTPVEDPDSLRSRSNARVVDLLCEGEIEGLVDGARSIYLEETPLQNDDGSYNFSGVTWAFRPGTQMQSSVPGFQSVENTQVIGVEVKKTAPVVRQFTNENLDAVRVTIGIPSLTYQNKENGDLKGTDVELRLEVQSNGGGFVPVIVSTEQASLSWNSSFLSSGSRTGTKYDLTVNWTNPPAANATVDERTLNYNLQYRLVGAGTWTTHSTRKIVRGYGQPSTSLPAAAWIANRTGTNVLRERIALVLPLGAYEFRVVVLAPGATTKTVTMSGEVKIPSSRLRISGKTTSRYQRSVRVALTGEAPWDIRVTRLTDDSTSSTLNNKTFWDTSTEIIDAKLRYPNSALVALQCDASQFQSVPRRAYHVRLLRVRVPTNYDPVERSYDGVWDGTFKIAWTDNPAWCFYDLLTNERYGLGEFVQAAQIDKWSLYQIGRYCDELVPDGQGGYEARFRCNLYLQTRAEAFKVISDFASIFRGMVFWSTGTITAIQDAPADAVYLYNQSNVINGEFSYSGSSAKVRHTVALVSWNDMEDFGRQKVEYVEDEDGIRRYGVITTEVVAIGCTSRGQAHRAGKWLLYSERLENETVTFKTGLDGAVARPGQIIKVADPSRAGARMGGRLLAATTSTVTLDAPVTLDAGTSYTLLTMDIDGNVHERAITHSGGTVSSLTMAAPLDAAPQAGSIWILTAASVEAQTFRVLTVTEDSRAEFTVTAIAHEPAKFAAVENGITLQPRSISVLSAYPLPPETVQVSEALYATPQGVRARMIVSWSQSERASSYVVTYQPVDGNVSQEITTSSLSLDIADVVEGVYVVRVSAVNALGFRSASRAVQYQLLGKIAPPENVQSFNAARSGEVLNFTWAHVSDVDLAYYEIRQGQNWGTAFVVGATIANAFSVSSPRGGTYLIKAFDTTGNESISETAVVAADIRNINVVVEHDEVDAMFPGEHENTYLLGLTRPATWSDPPDWDSMGAWDDTVFEGGITLAGDTTWGDYTGTWDSYTTPWVFLDPAPAGRYTTDPIDVGFVATSLVYLETRVDVIPRDALTWAELDQPWATYAPPEWTWQGQSINFTAGYEISTSEDGTAWSEWKTFTPGAYTFRYLKIRVSLATADLNYLPHLTRFLIKIDVPDRWEHFEDVSVPIAGKTLTFSPAFVSIKTVQVTLQSGAADDTYTVTAKSNSSVTINVFTGAGVAKAGVIDVDVFGYGERY